MTRPSGSRLYTSIADMPFIGLSTNRLEGYFMPFTIPCLGGHMKKFLALSPSLALMLASLAVLLALFTLAPALLGGVR